jgi:hypothetical protein
LVTFAVPVVVFEASEVLRVRNHVVVLVPLVDLGILPLFFVVVHLVVLVVDHLMVVVVPSSLEFLELVAV